MYQSVYGDLETQILTAEPIELIQLLYRGALDAIAGARAAVDAGDIQTRSRLISKAMAILNELSTSLDHAREPELCRNLVELYDYMLRKLIEANIHQTGEPLVEVERLLAELLRGWEAGAKEEQAQTGASGKSDDAFPGPEAGYAGAGEYRPVSYAY